MNLQNKNHGTFCRDGRDGPTDGRTFRRSSSTEVENKQQKYIKSTHKKINKIALSKHHLIEITKQKKYTDKKPPM